MDRVAPRRNARLLEAGRRGYDPTRVTHNDTKINNILFNKEGEVLCAIDLDTVMNSTSLNDFGDAIRSYTNTETRMTATCRASACRSRCSKPTPRDTSRSVQPTLPAGNRLPGLLGPLHHLRTGAALPDGLHRRRPLLQDQIPGAQPRANHAQYKLLQSMEEQYPTMCRIVRDTVAKYKK